MGKKKKLQKSLKKEIKRLKRVIHDMKEDMDYFEDKLQVVNMACSHAGAICEMNKTRLENIAHALPQKERKVMHSCVLDDVDNHTMNP